MSGHTPTRNDRAALAAADDRPEGDLVATLDRRASAGAYTYHEIDADGSIVCGPPGPRDESDYVLVQRQTAADRGKQPCQQCQRFAGQTSASD